MKSYILAGVGTVTGFDACENPLDVLSYYNNIDDKFCEVELDKIETFAIPQARMTPGIKGFENSKI